MKLPRNCCLCVCLNLVIIVEQCELKKKREEGKKNSCSSLESTAGDLNNLSVVVIHVVSNATFNDGHKFKRRKIKNNKRSQRGRGIFMDRFYQQQRQLDRMEASNNTTTHRKKKGRVTHTLPVTPERSSVCFLLLFCSCV